MKSTSGWVSWHYSCRLIALPKMPYIFTCTCSKQKWECLGYENSLFYIILIIIIPSTLMISNSKHLLKQQTWSHEHYIHHNIHQWSISPIHLTVLSDLTLNSQKWHWNEWMDTSKEKQYFETYRWQCSCPSKGSILAEHVMRLRTQHDKHVDDATLRHPVGVNLRDFFTSLEKWHQWV